MTHVIMSMHLRKIEKARLDSERQALAQPPNNAAASSQGAQLSQGQDDDASSTHSSVGYSQMDTHSSGDCTCCVIL